MNEPRIDTASARGASSESSDTTAPAGMAPGGMSPLAVLPVFFALTGKRALLAGASERAVWKAELLTAAGASLDVYAAVPCPEMRALAAQQQRLRLVPREWAPADLAGAAIALIDTDDDEEAARFRAAAKAAGAPMNAIDRPAFCDFQFGAIVNRSPLVIGVSTDGAAPVFGQAVRGRLEALLPPRLKDWAAAARRWRARLNPLHLPFHARRRFWEGFSARALDDEAAPPRDDDFDALLVAARGRGEASGSNEGRVTLVGAGPGDPDLITLKALRALQGADVVLYDKLVAPEVVAMARREARRIDVGKRGYRPSCKQHEITEMMVTLAREGKHVVRLKGGDPMIFGRATEEIQGCLAAAIPVSVVPGVTAALGAAASLKTSLTERSVARRLQFITAHAKDGRLPEDIDWGTLCDPHAASVVYMGVRTMPALVERLLAQGIDPDTPAVLVERATQADERRLAGTIAEMPALVAAMAPTGPCLAMIGLAFERAAVAAAETLVAVGAECSPVGDGQ